MTGHEAALEFFHEQEEVKKHDLGKKKMIQSLGFNTFMQKFQSVEKKLKR